MVTAIGNVMFAFGTGTLTGTLRVSPHPALPDTTDVTSVQTYGSRGQMAISTLTLPLGAASQATTSRPTIVAPGGRLTPEAYSQRLFLQNVPPSPVKPYWLVKILTGGNVVLGRATLASRAVIWAVLGGGTK
jgi:hypothetical protein